MIKVNSGIRLSGNEISATACNTASFVDNNDKLDRDLKNCRSDCFKAATRFELESITGVDSSFIFFIFSLPVKSALFRFSPAFASSLCFTESIKQFC